MSFEQLLRAKRLRPHEPSQSEIRDLTEGAFRDLRHVQESSDLDWRFIAAYSAALSLATVPLVASGFRAQGAGHHVTVIAALPESLGPEAAELAAALNEFRALRNKALYDQPYIVTADRVRALLAVVDELQQLVLQWLAEHHRELLPEGLAGGEQ